MLLLAALQIEEWHLAVAFGSALVAMGGAAWAIGGKLVEFTRLMTTMLGKLTAHGEKIEKLESRQSAQDDVLREHGASISVLFDRGEREPTGRHPPMRKP